MHEEILDRARLARDPRFDGRFFVGVRTTGIYCRPVCPAVAPRRENVEFFPSAAAAGEAGYRPCLRCRPESAPGSPAWAGTSTTVRRGLRLIDAGALDADSVERLAERLGVTSRHLHRLFTTHVGASPLAVAQTRRLHFAKRLVDETQLPLGDVAIAAGYGSVRRFNDAFRRNWGRPPRELRRQRRQPAVDGATLTVTLPRREPYAWSQVTDYYALRAIPGVEECTAGVYRRALVVGDADAIVEVRDGPAGCLRLGLGNVPAERLFDLVRTARDVFDTDAPTHEIAEALSVDPRLRGLLERLPGVRVPGAWDGFELTVRAILGQQISVRAATTIAGRIVARYGTPLARPSGALTHLFPTAEKLRRARFSRIGRTLPQRAAAVRDGDVHFDPLQDADDFRRRLTAIRGIGDWTAQYVMLRALKHPDALPSSDLGLIRALEPGRRVTPRELEARAEAWRPWRAYGAMLLWSAA